MIQDDAPAVPIASRARSRLHVRQRPSDREVGIFDVVREQSPQHSLPVQVLFVNQDLGLIDGVHDVNARNKVARSRPAAQHPVFSAMEDLYRHRRVRPVKSASHAAE